MKRFFCVLLFIAAVIGGLLLCDHVTRRDDSERKFRSFYDEKQDIDVFFMGTSHVLDDITPMELWRDFGVTSYNMGTSSECLGMTEWILKLTAEAMTHTAHGTKSWLSTKHTARRIGKTANSFSPPGLDKSPRSDRMIE